MMLSRRRAAALFSLSLISARSRGEPAPQGDGLVGYWKLEGDARDQSGNGNHGRNRGVSLATGEFDGRGAFIEVPDSPLLNPGAADFSVAAWVYTERDLTDVLGDIVSKFDASSRKGFTLSINASSAGYNSSGNDKHVHFGIDDGKPPEWQDCGRPGGKSHNSDALTAFDGALYAGTCDAPREEDWAHVYRYRGDKLWEDCGRLGTKRTRGVYAMTVPRR
jgi:hypothetical protein